MFLVSFTPKNKKHSECPGVSAFLIVCMFHNFKNLFFSLQDPAGIFELVEVVGNGTYGQVYKVRHDAFTRFDFVMEYTGRMLKIMLAF